MIVFSEDSPRLTPSASARSLKSVTEAAKLVGCHVYHIPQEEIGETAEDALAYVPVQETTMPAVWLGYIPSPDWYTAIFAATLRRRIRLLNTLEEHRNAQQFDLAYSALQELTPESVIITDLNQCAGAVKQLGLPLFVKGVVQSCKAEGWHACVAETTDELRQLCKRLLALETRSRGRAAVRKLVRLRYSRTSGLDFPFGREYRVFLYRARVLGYGYYWEGDDPLKMLSPQEERSVLELAEMAARRVGTPFIAVDVGQLEDGTWIVIETGDAQFSGVSQTPLLPLWNAISQIELTDLEL